VQTREGSVFAINAENGEIRWTHHPIDRYPVVRPLSHHNDLILLQETLFLVALDRKTGAFRWELELPEVPIAPPTIGDLLLYVPFANGRVFTYSLPETTAAVLSKSQEERAAIQKRVRRLRDLVDSAAPGTKTGIDPRSARGDSYGRTASPTDYLSRYQGTTMAIRRGSIESMNFSPEAIGQLSSRPLFLSSRSPGFAVDHPVLVSPLGILVSGGEQKALFLRRDPENPVLKLLTDAPPAQRPTQYGSTVYFAGIDGSLQAIDLIRGLPAWQQSLRSKARDPLVATDASLFINTTRHGLVRVNRADGSIIWSQPEALGFLAANPTVAYTLDRFGRLLILDYATGQALATYDISKYNVTLSNELDDRIFVAANDGSVVCLNDQTRAKPHVHTPKVSAPKKALPDVKW
jgi:hypothetical protein